MPCGLTRAKEVKNVDVDEGKCAQCGTTALPGAKFCESCGEPLAAASKPVEGPVIPEPAPTYAVPGTEMKYQGVGIRFVAFLIDAIIIWIISSILTYPFAASAFSYDASTGAVTIGDAFYVMAGVIFAILWVLYSTLLLGRYGQSVGKMLVKIKVVKEDSSRISYRDAFVRTVLAVIDAIPYVIPYLLGAILIWTSDKKQRLGDRVAHTVVVKA